MPHRVIPSAFLRLALLAMLALGVCLQPVFAAACDVEDARATLALGGDAVSTADDGGRSGDQADCCANPACGDCCMHAVVLVPAMPDVSWFDPPCVAVLPLRSGIARGAYPVDSRPPISG